MKSVLALAFDGADYDLVQRLMAEKKLPTISRLARGRSGRSARRTRPAILEEERQMVERLRDLGYE